MGMAYIPLGVLPVLRLLQWGQAVLEVPLASFSRQYLEQYMGHRVTPSGLLLTGSRVQAEPLIC